MIAEYKYKKPYRIKKKKSIFRSKFFWLILFILVVLGVIFYFVVFSSYFQIKEIKISGTQKIPGEEIKKVATSQINHRLVFFDSRSIFLLNFKRLKQKMLKEFPQAFEVNLKRNLPSVLMVGIKERLPVGTWCQDDGCFCFDKEGVIFEKASEGLHPIIRLEIAGPNLVLGESIMEKKYLEAILEIDKSLEEDIKISVEDFILSDGVKKLRVEILEGWKIIFDLENDIKDQLFNLGVVLKEKIPSEKRKNLEYIDLRYGSRVYYRYKN